MALKITYIILVMFLAFLAVYGIGGLIAMLMAEENKHVCCNCKHYDPQMQCCWKKFQKVGLEESCNDFVKEERRYGQE